MCVWAAWGSGSARAGRVVVRGRAKVFGGEWVVGSAGNASHIHCAVPFFCVRSGTEGASEGLRRGMHGAACGCASALRGGAEERGKGVRKCSGRAKVFGGECVVRSAGVRLGCGDVAGGLGKGVSPCGGAGAGLRWGMCCVVGGFNALSPLPLARTRIIIYTSALPTP